MILSGNGLILLILQNRVRYKPFELYKKQAKDWIEKDKIDLDADLDEESKYDAFSEERVRCLDNLLYACNKHLKLKSDLNPNGFIDFNAWEAQAFILYLIDNGLSLIIGKLRQIGFTSTIGGALMIRTMLKKSYFVKLVAQKGKKSDEIFEDKVKFPLSKINKDFKPTIDSYTSHQFKFGKSLTKGGDSGSSSKFVVDVPSIDVVNAGTPSVVAIDEGGIVKDVGGIIAEGRPTLYSVNEKGEMIMSRQLLVWGTGGFMKEGASGFKLEYYSAKEAWKDRDFRHGIIPIFINAFAKPGLTLEIYNREKAFAERRKAKPGEEEPIIKFHYSFPINEDDMFLTSAKTIIPTDVINKTEASCINSRVYAKSQIGYFDPIYDYSSPYGEFSDVKYKIVGATFVPVTDSEEESRSPLACVRILKHPEKGWSNRYYKGTDPINSESGRSLFSSSVWDDTEDAPIALLNFRTVDYKFCYLQSLLMALYYDIPSNGKELIEYNIGKGYIDYCENLGFKHMFMPSSMLPDSLRAGKGSIGISKNVGNARFITDKLREMVFTFKDNIKFPVFWQQMRTFVEKQTKVGGIKYEPSVVGVNKDDVIDAVNYSKIASDSYSRRLVLSPDENEEPEYSYKRMYVNGSITMIKVRN